MSVNIAANGYVILREAGRMDASKLLVRPALEAVFFGVAVIKKPGFLFRKAYSELLEDQKLVTDPAEKARAQVAINSLERAFKKADQKYPISRSRVSVKDAADAAGFLDNYNTAYRLYCQFTHGALRAAKGELREKTDSADTQMMIWCVFMMMCYLKNHTPAEMPDLSDFRQRISKLPMHRKQKSDGSSATT